MSDHLSAPTPLYQANDGLLRAVLKANAALSLTTGLILVLAGGPLAAWMISTSGGYFGLSTATLLRLTGVELILFAALPFWVARRPRLSISLTRLVIALDLLWVVGIAALLLALPEVLTTAGAWIAGLSALLVLDFVLLQAVGLWQLYQGKAKITLRREGGDFLVTAAAAVDAPSAVVWQVMADQEGYAAVADNIAEVKVLQGQGLGMIRRCSDTAGRAWRERCTEWEEGRAFAFEVDTAAADYPYPIGRLQARWSMEPEGDLVTLRMDFVIGAKPGLLAALQLRILLAVFLPVCDRLLSNWALRMQQEAERAWASPGLRRSA